MSDDLMLYNWVPTALQTDGGFFELPWQGCMV
jgi:hypothetical protein